jgi:hypothetical protein
MHATWRMRFSLRSAHLHRLVERIMDIGVAFRISLREESRTAECMPNIFRQPGHRIGWAAWRWRWD